MPPIKDGRREKFAQLVVAGKARIDAYAEIYGNKKTRRVTNHCAFVMGQQDEVKARIEELMIEAAKRNEITVDRVLEEIRRVAFSDVRNLYEDSGSLKPIKDLDDDTAAILASVEVVEGKDESVTKKVKIWDKLTALEKCCRYLGIAKGEDSGKTLTVIINKNDLECL